MKNDITRRGFLAGAGVAAGSLVVPGIVGAKSELDFYEGKCGEGGGKVLVAYASKYSTTGGVAEAVAKELCAAGWSCDVLLAKDVKSLAGYDAVVLGGAARNFAWMDDAAKFVNKNKQALAGVPTAWFLTCLQIVDGQPSFAGVGRQPPKDETPEDKHKRVLGYLDPVLASAPEVKPVDIGVFGGVLKFDALTVTDRSMMKTMGFVEGDFRDWDAIKAWARTIEPKLKK